MTFSIFLVKMVQTFFKFSIICYFTANTIYIVLMLAATYSIGKRIRTKPFLIESMKRKSPVFAPSISILAPAFNEEISIVESVKSFLTLDYPRYEIIVINDGSKDQTFAKLKQAYMLQKENIYYDNRLSKTLVFGTYRSKLHPNLIVIDKENAGKADALNVGIGYSSFDVVCAVDSDSILEEDALIRIAIPFIEDPVRTIASGGTIRIVNGSVVKHSRVVQARLSYNFLTLVQTVEYLRAFLCGRVGWNVFNATLVISGAFGLFNKQAVISVGGYHKESIGEDMELVVRLHRHYRENERGTPYSIVFIADPVCWTEAPNSLSGLYRQRHRWQRGLADTLFRNWTLLFNPKYGFIGLVAVPYFWFIELLGPIFEILSYICLILGGAFGILNHEMILLFFMIGIIYGLVMTVAAILTEEMYFSKYPSVNSFFKFMSAAILESFGYRQLTSLWRLSGLLSYFRGNKAWGQHNRNGFTTG